ncbi:sensor histidine kinase [Mucilaginibacter sp. OK283]|jgi:sensor histidine kinase YesM|uniref:sensor histidine kinase n=1 Tax=Mucilaginibacter sp. OK283 TaxID=1881049 RepID=UPI0008B36C1F|nr:histidine kinase [Mucilaginibacter sp. OK283]SEP41531.1 Histidine kinase [Mucilaginibacter sp. OK283]
MKSINLQWLKKYKQHLIVWALFILYESIVIGLVTGQFGNPLTYAAHYFIIAFLFYLHANYGLPWALSSTRAAIWRVPLTFIGEISLFVLMSYTADALLIKSHIITDSPNFKLSYQYSLKTLYRGIYFIGFSTGYFFILRYNNEKQKTSELEKQRLENLIYRQNAEQELIKAQNAFLKAQINPHFLFNTLDFIYHNIVTISPVASDAVITLSEMMRYAIDSDKIGDYICLDEEITQVNNLLYLSQMRKSNNLGFELKVADDARRVYLIPLVLLTLVENIFKHGNLTEPGHESLVNIYIRDDIFYIETDNMINYSGPKPGTQTGLINIKKRLVYAYGNLVDFKYYTDGTDKHFKLSLAIPVACLKGPGVSAKSSKDNDKEPLRGHADWH